MPFDPEENARQIRAAAAGRSRRPDRRWPRLLGTAVLILGAAVGVSHWLAHVGVFGQQPPGWMDLAIGYPTAALLLAAGGIILGQHGTRNH